MKTKTFIFLENSGFPFGLASMQKLILMAKAMVEEGGRVIVLNRIPAIPSSLPNFPLRGRYEGIDYIYTCRPAHTGLNIIRKIASAVVGLFGEFFEIIQIKKKYNINGALISYTHFPLLIYYRLLSKVFGFKLILSIAELHRSLKNR